MDHQLAIINHHGQWSSNHQPLRTTALLANAASRLGALLLSRAGFTLQQVVGEHRDRCGHPAGGWVVPSEEWMMIDGCWSNWGDPYEVRNKIWQLMKGTPLDPSYKRPVKVSIQRHKDSSSSSSSSGSSGTSSMSTDNKVRKVSKKLPGYLCRRAAREARCPW